MVNKNTGERGGPCIHRPGKDNGIYAIDTFRIFDSCRQQDCLEDLAVLLTDEGQRVLDHSSTVRIRGARVLWSRIDSEELPFHHGFYRVNIRYYFQCILECSNGVGTGQEVAGLTVYDQSVMLYGGTSHISTFTADGGTGRGHNAGGLMTSANRPRIVAEVAEPVPLRLVTVDFDRSRTFGTSFCSADEVPDEIAEEFIGSFLPAAPGGKIPFVTLGLFSMIRIERPAQIIVPACDSNVPKTCGDYHFGETDPCTLFRSMEFPMAEFYPETAPTETGEPVLPTQETNET